MSTPSDRKYSKEHEWIKIEGDTGIVGITDHAQNALTDIVFVELPEPGRKTEAGKPFAVIESVKSVSDVFAPADGEVTEANKELEEHPELLNQSPYDKGWIAKIKVEKQDESLMSAQEYDDFVAKEAH
ncbi:glycine cleavage system protein GcvH [Candidatus Woesearchaeota archaeon]|nr:glycine cleavage system protein GcvH [Candidatus Woesearchaeota archaeon]